MKGTPATGAVFYQQVSSGSPTANALDVGDR
jgi:hypothetical protein